MRQPEVRNNNQQANERRLLLPVFIHRPAICEFVPIRAGQVSSFILLQDTNILCAGLCCPAADNAFQIKKRFFFCFFFAHLQSSNDDTLLTTSRFDRTQAQILDLQP